MDAQSRCESGARRWPATFAGASISSSVAFVVLLGMLHILRPDLAPSWHFISDYEVGDYGWMMRAAFFALALGCAGVLAALLPHARGIAGRLGLLLLCLSAAGMALAGLYAPSHDNKLHETGAMLDQLPLAVLLITWSLWRNPQWRPARGTLVWSALALVGGMAVFIWAMVVMQPSRDQPPRPDVLIGWPSRIFILGHCAWLIPTAWWAGRITVTNSPGSSWAGATVAPGRIPLERVTRPELERRL